MYSSIHSIPFPHLCRWRHPKKSCVIKPSAAMDQPIAFRPLRPAGLRSFFDVPITHHFVGDVRHHFSCKKYVNHMESPFANASVSRPKPWNQPHSMLVTSNLVLPGVSSQSPADLVHIGVSMLDHQEALLVQKVHLAMEKVLPCST